MFKHFKKIRNFLNTPTSGEVFDYRFLRGMIGAVAIALPIITYIKSGKGSELTSISHSYYTPAIDVFAGILFFVCAFLLAYSGHTKGESIASSIAGICSLIVALFPTDELKDCLTPSGIAHFVAATIMFGILAYFCLGPFRISVKEKIDNAKPKTNTREMVRRKWVYIICGWTIILVLVGYFILNKINSDYAWDNEILFWAETVALFAFGIAWSIAAKYLRYFRNNA